MKSTGFSLIELLVVLVLVAITMAYGMPGISNMVVDNRRVDAMNRFSANLAFTRSEAVKRGRPLNVSLRPKTSGWQDGWYVYEDVDGDGAYTPGPDDDLIRVEDTLKFPKTESIQCKDCGANIIFRPDGSVNKGVVFELYDSVKGVTHRTLTLASTGRVKITK